MVKSLDRCRRCFELIGQDVSHDIGKLTEEGTPENLALTWLAMEDSFKGEAMSLPKQVLIERYVLALFYFSTQGASWSTQLPFLESTTVCEWYSESVGRGALCDAEGLFVTDLLLSKLLSSLKSK